MLMLCPICAGEFEAQGGVCMNCGCVLVASTLDQEPVGRTKPARKRDIEFVELCRPQTNPEAMFIKETLEQNHVAVMIQGMHSLSLIDWGSGCCAYGHPIHRLCCQYAESARDRFLIFIFSLIEQITGGFLSAAWLLVRILIALSSGFISSVWDSKLRYSKY